MGPRQGWLRLPGRPARPGINRRRAGEHHSCDPPCGLQSGCARAARSRGGRGLARSRPVVLPERARAEEPTSGWRRPARPTGTCRSAERTATSGSYLTPRADGRCSGSARTAPSPSRPPWSASEPGPIRWHRSSPAGSCTPWTRPHSASPPCGRSPPSTAPCSPSAAPRPIRRRALPNGRSSPEPRSSWTAPGWCSTTRGACWPWWCSPTAPMRR